MPNGIPEPALQPLHPEKPEPPIVAGYVWQKIASGKTSVNAPKIRITQDGFEIRAKPVNFSGKHGFTLMNERGITRNILRRDWRPC